MLCQRLNAFNFVQLLMFNVTKNLRKYKIFQKDLVVIIIGNMRNSYDYSIEHQFILHCRRYNKQAVNISP